MVYTTALVFGQGIPVSSEEEYFVRMIGNDSLHLASSSDKINSVRRGSVDRYYTEKNSPSIEACLGSEEAGFIQRDLIQHIELCLSEAKGYTLRCQVLLLPCQMSSRVARDVVRSSADEPCGLRGASIKVYLQHKNEDALTHLGSISPDPSVTPTFELSVVFKVENDGWSPFKHIFVTDKVLKLRPEYRLVKKKLYSSASPVIHDFY